MTKKDSMKIFENYSIYAITDEKHSLGRDNVLVAKKILESGVKIIQYRVKYLDFADKYREAKEISKIAKKHGAVFIVNDHPDLALMVKADGVHLGQDDYPVKEVRKLVGKDFIIGVSTHSPEQYIRATRDGADYAGVGPLFETHTKDNVMSPVGLEYLRWVVGHKKIPFVAIGGIKTYNLSEVIKAGAKCFCLVTEITESKDINKKIKELNKGALKKSI
ncbi:MAG: thiamine phosphate synthase [Elusimicrobiales bacterium]|jgi:thiamine-phosphate pyrophosphorylase|nr:thiamine phosphate synthase [Elusimicrobiales bacterium]NLH39044.1 thiamine phosphate synthase [Elusimicrobiota bacterium]